MVTAKRMNFDRSMTTKKYFKNRKNTLRYVMLHHTASDGEGKEQARYLALSEKFVSCHYVVWKKWVIRKIANDEWCTWHAGRWSYEGITDTMNLHSIWIEVCSNWYNYTDEQKEATTKLIEYLMQKHWIPNKNIIRHRDYTTRKWDIWDNFRNKEYSSRNEYRESLDKSKDALAELWIWNWKRWNEPATRQEVSWMLQNFLELIKNKGVVK